MKAKPAKPKPHKALSVTVDLRLDEIFEGRVLFPEKVARANEILAKYPLPEHSQKRSAS